MRLTPLKALIAILVLVFALIGVQYLLIGNRHGDATRVGPDARGVVRIETADLPPLQARFYRFLNSGNQEVLFFVARDEKGVLQVAFDAGESHYKLHRGFTIQDGWVVDNKCDSTIRVSEVNGGGGGCRPAPLAHRVVGTTLVLQEQDILGGWRFFN